MTVGMVVDNDFVGDARVKNESKILISKGYTVKVLCFSYGNTPNYEEIEGIGVYRFSINKKLKNILFGIANLIPIYHFIWYFIIKKFIKNENISVIHAHDLYMARSAGMACKPLGIPMIIDLHENYPEAIKNYKWANTFPKNIFARPNFWQKLEPKYLQYATYIVTTTNVFAKILSKRYNINSNKFIVYPNVPDLKEMDSYSIDDSVLPKENRFYIFYFGGISERRGIYTCIEALKILKDKYPNIYLLLIGPVDGAEVNKFNAEISNPEVSDRIIFKNWISIAQFPSYVTASDVCISPIFRSVQHETTIANKVFQYLAFAKPIIVSDCAPQIEIIDEANCGLVFESENAIDLAQKIVELYNNKELCKEMGNRGKQLIENKYNTLSYGELFYSNYEKILKVQ
jgi:glycosyltransferase involved in cell wall biosynthesis